MPAAQAIYGFRAGGKYSFSPAFGPGGVKSLRFRAPAHAGNSRRRAAVIPSPGVQARTTRCARRARPRTATRICSAAAWPASSTRATSCLAALIDWAALDAAFGPLYAEAGRPGPPTRLMAGLHLLKHVKGLSDEQVCAQWVE